MLLDPPYRQLVIGVIATLVVAALGRLGQRAPQRRHGWRRLEPSAMHWTALVLGGGLLLLFLYVRLFVGSARPDAEHQMNILTGLIVAFGLGVAICAMTVIRLRKLGFEWRGSWLAWHRDGRRVTQTIDDLASVKRTAMGWFVLAFADGAQVRLDEHARGTPELLETIAERRSDLLPSNQGMSAQ